MSDVSKDNFKKIDNLCFQRPKKIKLIKIDTDGSDYNCLLGARKLIHQDRPIIIIEMTDYCNEIIQELGDLSYNYYYDQFYNSLDKKNIPINLIASCEPLRAH